MQDNRNGKKYNTNSYMEHKISQYPIQSTIEVLKEKDTYLLQGTRKNGEAQKNYGHYVLVYSGIVKTKKQLLEYAFLFHIQIFCWDVCLLI